MDPIVEIFFEEAAELLADFEAGLLELEESRHDPELLNRIFRTAHTLKGNASMLGFDDVARYTHGLESMLEDVRIGDLRVTPDVVDALLLAGDLMRRMLTAAQTGGAVPAAEIDAGLDRLQVLRALQTAAPAVSSDPAVPAADVASTAAPATNSIRVPIGKVDRLINLVG
jgi:two-component system chemotaxis sensor kinase CheA